MELFIGHVLNLIDRPSTDQLIPQRFERAVRSFVRSLASEQRVFLERLKLFFCSPTTAPYQMRFRLNGALYAPEYKLRDNGYAVFVLFFFPQKK